MTDRDSVTAPAPVCPRCGSTMTPILYGYPGVETFEAVERGEVFLGGCMIYEGRPEHRCSRCQPPAAPRSTLGPYTVAEAYATGRPLLEE